MPQPDNSRKNDAAVNQKLVVSWFAIAVLVCAVLYLGWLWLTLSPEGLVSDPEGPDPSLRLVWRVTLWLIELGTAANTLFATILFALSVGISRASEIYTRKRQILSIVIVCVIGIILSVLLLVQISGDDVVVILGFYSKFETDAGFRDAAAAFFYALIAWFSLFLASQLGISAFSLDGWIRKLL